MANIANNPSEEKYRSIRLGNPKFLEKAVNVDGAMELLKHCGFRVVDDAIQLPMDVESSTLRFVISLFDGYVSGQFKFF